MKYSAFLILVMLVAYACTKDVSPLPKNLTVAINNDSLANVDFTKYLGRILENGSCTGCHDGGAFGGPGPGDFRTYSKFKTTVTKSGNPVRTDGLGRMSTCGGNYGCLNSLQKDSLSNWLQKYFNL
jgi:cytochrome c5